MLQVLLTCMLLLFIFVSPEAAGMPAHLPAQIKQALNTLHSIDTKGAAAAPEHELNEQGLVGKDRATVVFASGVFPVECCTVLQS